MEDIKKEKAKLRDELRGRINLLLDRDLRSGFIWKRLEGTPEYQSAEVILGYVGIRSEVETLSYLRLAHGNGKKVALPKVLGNEIRFFQVDDFSSLVPGKFGIPEPRTSQGGPESPQTMAYSPAANDLILVPGLGFTVEGKRLGQGGGFFDRFLHSLPAGVGKAALCFQTQVVSLIPEESHDVRVDFLVTENGVLRATNPS